jgi:SAM-dependent methyltransferase
MAGFENVTAKQQTAWARGDFHRIGVSQVVVSELLVRALHIHAGERVLDVAGGAGNTALAAARRQAEATCTDYVPDLLGHAEERARAEGLPLRTEVADAQALPYPDETFDVVTSTFGAMFAPDQALTASELLRVLKPGGRLGMANWIPTSWVGEQFGLQAAYLPPPEGLRPPTRWGTREGLAELLPADVWRVEFTEQYVDYVQHSTVALWELFSQWFGPVVTVLAAVGPERGAAFREEWIALCDRHNIATDGTCEFPSIYLQVIATKR